MNKQKQSKRRKRPRKKRFVLSEIIRHNKLLLIIILVAALLRLVDLGRQGLWVDEICVYNDSLASYQKIFKTAHPVTFLLGRLSLSVEKNEYFLRLPSAVAGVLAVLFIFLATRRIFDEPTAYLAAILLTISPHHIYYSQDANYYAEMMLFSIINIYLLFLFFQNKRLDTMTLFLIFCYINYKTHLFSIFIVLSCLAVLALWILLNKELHVLAKEKLYYLSRRSKLAIPALAAIGIGAVAYPSYRLWRIFYRYSFTPSEGISPENFVPNFNFFLKIFTDYGVAFQDYKLMNYIFALLFLSVFIVGLIYCVRHNRYMLALIIFAFSSPFIGLSLAKVSHFYHPRYTSFIVPILLMCFAKGINISGDFIAQRVGPTINKRALYFSRAALVLIIFLIPITPNLIRYYTGQKQNWRDAAKYLEQQLEPGDKVLNYLYWNHVSLGFYFKHFGMDSSPLMKLPEIRGGGGAIASLNKLKRYCYRFPGLYLCSSYTRYEPPLVFDWVKKYFQVAKFFPSLHPREFNREGKEVVVYKWKYGDSYVLPPYTYYYQFKPDEEPRPNLDSAIIFNKELLFDKSGQYEFMVQLNKPLNDQAALKIYLDDQMFEIKPEPEQNIVNKILELKEGVHELKLVLAGEIGLTQPEELRIREARGGIIHIEAEEPDSMHPTSHKWIETLAGAQCFTLKRHAYLTYEDIWIDQDGLYYLAVRGYNDRPGPVLLEIRMREKPVGMLSFDMANNAWSTKGFPLMLKKGYQSFTLSFVNNFYLTDESDREGDNDASIDYFELRPIEDKAVISDDRLQLAGNLVQPSRQIVQGFEDPRHKGWLAQGWGVYPPGQAVLFEDAEEVDGGRVATLVIAPLAREARIISPPVPVEPGRLLYFSVMSKTEKLYNQSSNITVIYLNARGETLKVYPVNAEGITGDNDWVRFIHFRMVPEQARFVVISLVVYYNSQMFSREPGKVWFSNIKFERY